MISNRRHFEAILAEREQHWNERWGAQEHAREIQATEYERRLEDLNGEAGTIKRIQAESVTAEKFDDYRKSEEAKRLEREKTVDNGLADLRALLSVLTGEVRDAATRRRTLGLMAGAAATIITLLVAGIALLL